VSGIAALWYTALVRLFPSEFRMQFGAEIKSVILEQRKSLSSEEVGRLLRFHTAATLDLLRAAGTQWRPTLARIASAMLLIGAIANVGYDLANPKLSMGVQAWGLTLIAITSSLLTFAHVGRRRRPG
jgi:hypothetical protein